MALSLATGTGDPAQDSLAAAADSLQAGDSTAVADSLAGEHLTPIVLQDNLVIGEKPAAPDNGLSWVYLGMGVIFCLVAFQIRNSGRYFRSLINDIHDTRERHNVFDDTVRETWFLIILNVTWCVSMGVLTWCSFPATHYPAEYSLGIPDRPAAGIGLAAAVWLLYDILMMAVYWLVGNVFTDSRKTEMWVRGAAATNGAEAFLLFPFALLALTQPEWNPGVLILAGIVFILGKFLFIFKGFRIFFNQFSSWLLFLYYLCSLEIIPLLLTYGLTLTLCSMWL